MRSLGPIDTTIVALYFLLTLIVGLAMTRRASRSLDEYFLGGRSLPWWLLGIAGMANWFDLTGTMIITSFLFLLGPRGLFIEFRGGAVLVLAFLIAYTGKWHRRSGCMTAAEWVNYRFGNDRAAGWMRLLTALMSLISTIGMLAYLVRGTSLFVGMFVPYPPMLVTGILMAVCGVYTMLSGFYGVVLTDLVQGIIIMVACVVVSWMAFHAGGDGSGLAALSAKVTGNAQWLQSTPPWHTTMPRGYEMYESLILFATFYLVRNVLCGLGTGGDSRYFGARSDRDCGLQSMLQGVTVTLRWPMMMGFAVLGLMLVDKFFPDPTVIERASAVVRAHAPDVPVAYWHDFTSSVINHPEQAPAGLVPELAQTLGPSWREKLPLVGANGTVNPEQILPAVLLNSIPIGLRGFILVAMLAAMMSTLTGTVNQTSALIVCDIYQNRLRPQAGNRELIVSSYGATIIQLVAGFWMGVNAGSINELWGWIIMGLGAGGLAPWLLRLYWWRCNSWGVVGGTVLGGVGAVVQRVVAPEMLEWKQFLIMTTLSFAGTIGGSLLTAPTARETLRRFYHSTRPFGAWAPLWRELPAEVRAKWAREHRNDILAVPFLLVAQVTAFLMPMQLVIHAYRSFAFTLPIFALGFAGVYRFWWKALPPVSDAGTDTPAMIPTAATPEPVAATLP
jgi:solute:Na+ symporter, SSS family